MPLLGPDGQPLSASYKKAEPPKLGPAFGNWAGRDIGYISLPGGAALQFDTSRLTLEDFRAMRDHPQVNASLTVLTFMMHGLDWKIESEDKKLAQKIEDNLRETWTRLIRGLSQAYWAGFSPIAIEYENDVPNRQIVVNKFKDLLPEECRVNWKTVEGYAPEGRVKPKFKIYDGFVQGYSSNTNPIPVENTLWYPLLMENGDYYGKKLLRSAFMPWYFSILMHLFSNRYFERFGEPTPVGRAPFEDTIDTGEGKSVSGKQAMDNILSNLRSRGVVTLPNDRDPVTKEFDYSIEYLESQMRGVDFERYLTRLDEEISLSIFTPVLLLRTADVGSYNLGVGHMQMYMWMLNALAGDLKEYIDNYVVDRLRLFNAGPNAAPVKWVYRKMGKENVETIRAIVTALVTGNRANVDFEELSAVTGLTITEIKQTLQDPNADPDDEVDPNSNPDKDNRQRNRTDKKTSKPKGVGSARATGKSVSSRIRGQVTKAWREDTFGTTFEPEMGFRRQFQDALVEDGFSAHFSRLAMEQFYEDFESWLQDAVKLGKEAYSGPDEFMLMVDHLLEFMFDELEQLPR